MIPQARLLRPIEAAAVADVSPHDVDRLIDEHLLPERFISMHDERAVAAAACALIAFYFQTAGDLTSKSRLEIIRIAGDRISNKYINKYKDIIKFNDSISINLSKYHNKAERRLNMLDRALRIVISDPEILGGTPVIRHTRIPVHDVAASIAAGHSRTEILEAYPSLKADMIDLVEIYARANPARAHARTDTSPRLEAEIRIPRRRAAGA